MRRTGAVLALLLGGTLFGVILIEIGLRALGISYPIFFRSDVISGTWHREGVSGWYNREGSAYVEINSAGMRGREYSAERPANAFRVAVLGDSYAEALQVGEAQTFASVMERELGTCAALAGATPEVLNFGVSSAGTAQELQTLRHRAWTYAPDLVLLAFVGNDIRNNSRALERDPNRPYYVFRGPDLVLDASYLKSAALLGRNDHVRLIRRRLADHLRVVQLLGEVRAFSRRKELAKARVPGGGHVFSPPTVAEWKNAWQVTEALIVKLAREVHERGVRFLLVMITSPHVVNPDSEYRRRFKESVGSDDLRYPDGRLLALAEREGIEALSLSDAFLARADADRVCLHGFDNAEPCSGHWNVLGHRLGGEMMAARVCEMLGDGPWRSKSAS